MGFKKGKHYKLKTTNSTAFQCYGLKMGHEYLSVAVDVLRLDDGIIDRGWKEGNYDDGDGIRHTYLYLNPSEFELVKTIQIGGE